MRAWTICNFWVGYADREGNDLPEYTDFSNRLVWTRMDVYGADGC